MNTELELSQNDKLNKLLRLSNEHLGTVYAIVSGMLYGLLGYFGISIKMHFIRKSCHLFRAGTYLCAFVWSITTWRKNNHDANGGFMHCFNLGFAYDKDQKT